MLYYKKNIKLISDSKKRQNFKNAEVFNLTCNISMQLQFSKKLYPLFLQRAQNPYYITVLKNRCLLSFSARSVISKFKITRTVLKLKILRGNINGYYRALW
tara:strand:+ start:1806 stop:2108 length:303 start_codon:yes stop_codon:yes gene_type:complete